MAADLVVNIDLLLTDSLLLFVGTGHVAWEDEMLLLRIIVIPTMLVSWMAGLMLCLAVACVGEPSGMRMWLVTVEEALEAGDQDLVHRNLGQGVVWDSRLGHIVQTLTDVLEVVWQPS